MLHFINTFGNITNMNMHGIYPEGLNYFIESDVKPNKLLVPLYSNIQKQVA